jgi:biopolymer transport protein ExbB
MWEIIQAGGPFMWPIILCSICSAAIVLERLWTLQRKRVLPAELSEQVWKWLSANQVNDKLITALEQNSPLGKVLAVGLANRHRPREVMIERLQDTGRHVVHELERFLNTLGTIATVSPLLGLLGTVTGMISSFQVIESMKAPTPGDLAKGVYESLVNTTMGLFIAIIFLTAYFVFKNKVTKMTLSMNLQAVDMLKHLAGQKAVGH